MEVLRKIIEWFSRPDNELLRFIMGIVGTTIAGLIVHRIANTRPKHIEKSFFEYFEGVGSKRKDASLFYYCFYINPINNAFIKAPLILTPIKAGSSYFDKYYKAEYFSRNSDNKVKNYQGKGTLKGNILEVTLYDKVKGEVLFLLAHQKNNRDSNIFNALHLTTDKRDEMVCSNRLIQEVKTNVHHVVREAQEIKESEIRSNEELLEIYNYLVYDAKRIRLPQLDDRNSEGLKTMMRNQMKKLGIFKLQKIVGVWISFSRVYQTDEIRSFLWTITQEGKNFEVKREGGEGLFKGTVKTGDQFISFVLALESLNNDFIDLVPTGKRKHILALTENQYDLYKGLTTTFVAEDSKIRPVVTREIMIKISDDPASEVLVEENHKSCPSIADIEEYLKKSDLQSQNAEEKTSIIEEYLDNGNNKVYSSLELNKQSVKKKDMFIGRNYVYFINKETDKMERFFISVDKNRRVKGVLSRGKDDHGKSLHDLYTGNVSYEHDQMVMIQMAGKRPVNITFKRLKSPIGYLTTYDKDYVPTFVKVQFEKCTVDNPILDDWEKKSKKTIEDYLRSDR